LHRSFGAFDEISSVKHGQDVLKGQPPSILCAAEGCTECATIFHAGKPYCGKHALALLESGERPDRGSGVQEPETSNDRHD
jgi:hypothetical protein